MKMSYPELSAFLAACATTLARAYIERDTFKRIQLGQGDPTKQYVVFTPLLWECVAFLSYCLKIRKYDDDGPTPAQVEHLIARLAEDVTEEGQDRDKLLSRIKQYIQGEDMMEMFGVFCNYASETAENAVALLQAEQEKNRYGNYAVAIRGIGEEIFRKAYLGE
ncbi:MAG: hypothetical protein SPD11_00475 [Sphaerochaetaceae bacterium]|nr:hypothetical protein [Sphaerochaetaceae bacterium]